MPSSGAPATETEMDYQDFIASKHRLAPVSGVVDVPALNGALFGYQSDIVAWALRRGRAAIFADCGMGKTLMQLEWARVVSETAGNVLILTPLAVGHQTAAEAARFGIKATISRDGALHDGITIANYEILHKFDCSALAGVVLDESSIIKAYDGKTRTQIIDTFARTPFKLACTATPAPNDNVELGNHAEFLGVLSRVEMLATYFCHDGGETSVWRLKGHAETDFWRWLCSWAVNLRKPSDLGYSDDGFTLPPMKAHLHTVESDIRTDGQLFVSEALTLSEQRAARKTTMSKRVQTVADMANASAEPWLVWCELNAEGDALEDAIPGAVQVAGSDSDDAKAEKMLGFSAGKYRVLITKPSIAGFGMNWQHCANVAFVGITHSYEQYYQAVRRCWRYGQTRQVESHIVTSDAEMAVFRNLARKGKEASKMSDEMVKHTSVFSDVHAPTKRNGDTYATDTAHGERFTLHLGDCVDVVRAIPSDSVGFTVFSPPFASLYTYSASDRDMGNCRTHSEFYDHFRFLVPELLRVTKPGRLLSFHCMNIPTSKERDGYIGLTDFRGLLIKMFQEAGWIYHSEVCIWKDPVTAMQRTKALGLLHKTIRKDSSMSRQGIPDYLVTMRKPGANPDPIAHTHDEFPVELWQRYASPVWAIADGVDSEGFCKLVQDINPSETLQKESAREDKDERHICPLQLDVIRRALKLWSNPNDLVLSPFTGIGSEGYVALQEGRRFIGAELKRSYWAQAAANLKIAERPKAQIDLF